MLFCRVLLHNFFRMDEIPVSFDYKGKFYKGYFSYVKGAGAMMFHLSINNYHRGQMFTWLDYGTLPGEPVNFKKRPEQKWRFTSQTREFEDLVDFFECVLLEWYGCNESKSLSE